MLAAIAATEFPAARCHLAEAEEIFDFGTEVL